MLTHERRQSRRLSGRVAVPSAKYGSERSMSFFLRGQVGNRIRPVCKESREIVMRNAVRGAHRGRLYICAVEAAHCPSKTGVDALMVAAHLLRSDALPR